MFDPLAAEPAARLAVALGIGLLLGAERERRMSTRQRRDSAGLRTFALVSLLGGIAQQTGARRSWSPRSRSSARRRW